MRCDEVTVRTSHGKKIVTRVRDGGKVFLFPRRVDRTTAIRQVRDLHSNPGLIKGLARARAKFEEFNWKPARKILKKQIDLSVPLIRLGTVPVITYTSDKEGKLTDYFHDTKNPPTLYAHPTKPVLLMLGGSLKIHDWLYD